MQICILPLLTHGPGHWWGGPLRAWTLLALVLYQKEERHALGHSHEGLQLDFLMPMLTNCQWAGRQSGILCAKLPATNIS